MTESTPEDANKRDESKQKGLSVIQTRRHHLAYSVLFSLLFTLIDFIFIWPEHHLLALLADAAAFSIVAWAELPSAYSLQTVIALFMLAGIGRVILGPALPPETENHGWLLPAGERSPANGCNSEAAKRFIPEGAPVVIAGTNGSILRHDGANAIITVQNTPLLTLERDGTRLFVDAQIFRGENLAARIVRNEFHLAAGEYAYETRSSDRSKLTVTAKDGTELLYVDYANPKAILVRGRFTSPRGETIVIGDHRVSGTNGMVGTNSCMIDKSGFIFDSGSG